MKTNSHQKNRAAKSNTKKVFAAIAVFVFGYLIFLFSNNAILATLSPLWNLRNIIVNESNDLVAFFRTKNALIEENKGLRDKLSTQESMLVSFRSLESSHNELLLNLGSENPSKIAAGVLVRPPQSMYDILVVEAGRNVGVREGSLVTLPFGAAIGTISSVSDRTSAVNLYSSSGVNTEAFLERGQVPVTLTGRGGGNFEILVPRDIEVVIGDRVLTYGLNSRLLAVVKDISVESTDSYKRVLAEIPQSFFSLRFVFIAK